MLVVLGLFFVGEDFFSDRLPANELWKALRGSSILLLGLVLVGVGAAGKTLGLFGIYSLRAAFLVLLVAYNLRVAIIVNYVHAGDAKEIISQVHTTEQFDLLAKRIRYEDRALSKGRPVKLLAEGDAVWPMTSYMIGIQGYNFAAEKERWGEYDYIIQNWSEQTPEVPAGFVLQRIDLRGWWVPDYEKEISLKRFLDYAINHEPWSTTGFSYAWLFTKEK
jgi:hypothetical protein